MKNIVLTTLLFSFWQYPILLGQFNIDSLWETADTLSSDSAKVVYLAEYGYQFRNSESQLGIDILTRLLNGKEINVLDNQRGGIEYFLGDLYFMLGDLAKAEEFLLSSIEYWQEKGDPGELAKAYYTLSIMYPPDELMEKSLQYAQEAEKNFMAAEDTLNFLLAASKIAKIMNAAGRPDDAISKYRSLIDFAGDRHNVMDVYNGMSVLFDNQDEPDSTFKYSILYRKEVMKTTNVANQFVATYNLARSYLTKQDFGKAYQLSSEGELLADQAGVPMLFIYADLLKAEVNLNAGKPHKAIAIYKSINPNNLNLNQISTIEEGLYKAYKESKQEKLALNHLEDWKNLTDSLKSVERNNKINELEIKYENVKKENAIKALKFEDELKEIDISLRNKALIFSAVSVIFMVGFLKDSYQKKKVIKNKQSVIEKSLVEKELLLKEIHHRVKNNLQMVSSLLNLQSRSLGSNNASKALEEGQLRVQAIALIHQFLYSEDDITSVEMEPYLKCLCNMLSSTYYLSKDQFDLILKIDDIKLDLADVVPLGLIYNEVLSTLFQLIKKDIKGERIKVSLTNLKNELRGEISFNEYKLKENMTDFAKKLIETLSRKLSASYSFNENETFSINFTKS